VLNAKVSWDFWTEAATGASVYECTTAIGGALFRGVYRINRNESGMPLDAIKRYLSREVAGAIQREVFEKERFTQ